jgi:adenylate cyclase
MGARLRFWIRAGISLLVFLFFAAHSAGQITLGLLGKLDRYAYDALVVLNLEGGTDPRVVIIDIDEKSLAAEGHFPWPRDKLAQLVTALFERYRIGVLGMDYVFPEADRSPSLELLDQIADLPGATQRLSELRRKVDTDAQFGEAIAKYPVVTGFVFEITEKIAKGALPPPVFDKATTEQYKIDDAHKVDFIEGTGYVANLERLQGSSPGGFFDNPTVDEDGIFRRVPLLEMYGGQVYQSLALGVVRRALGDPPVSLVFEPPEARDSLHLEALRIGPLSVPVDGDVAVMVPYRGRQRSFPYISATDVLHGVADPAVLKPGAVAMLGTSVAGLFDLRATPVAKVYIGVEIHANLVAGMLDGKIMRRPPFYLGAEVIMMMLIAAVLTFIFARVSPLLGALAVIAVCGGLVIFAGSMWQQRAIVPLGVPFAFTVTLFLAQTLYGYFVESRRSRSLTRQFGEYVPPEIVAEMAENPQLASMEGESREMTVLFSDVRGFTTISEKLEPRELARLMNQFLTALTKVIQKHRGTIDKYMGDAVMAFWGAPLPDQNHVMNALQAGLEMHKAVQELDAQMEKQGWPKLRIGVGLNTGKMNVGNMGSEFRRAYTVMGDTVNLGSRLEALTRKYGVDVICGDSTRKAAPSWAFRELDFVRVKGKLEPVSIYEPLGPKETVSARVKEDVARYQSALRAYRAQEWDRAESEFFGLSQSGQPLAAYEMFLARIAKLRKEPPAADWDGTFTFEEK